jgi:large subunit ribosomal protein L23
MASESKKEPKKGKESGKALPVSFKPEEIILYPNATEKSVRLTAINTITFVVARSATKNNVKRAVEALYSVKVSGVKTVNAFDGRKKAFVTLAPENSASELASKLGML